MKHLIEDYIPFNGFEIVDDIDHINESAQSEVANSKGAILAIVKGPHFVPDGISRNHRNYKGVWDEAGKSEAVQTKLKNCQMLGRIGHEAEMTDMDVAKGEFSHYTRNIDWKTGIAESVILNTAMGNTLLTLLRSGVTMYVSSRADGDYCGKDNEGNDMMDPKTYELERFDFVQDPGFLDAHPKMVTESKQKEEAAEDTAKALLEVALETKAVLSLDGQRFIVESLEGSHVDLVDIDTEKCEHLTLGDFTEVVPAIQQSISESFAQVQKDLDEANESIKTLRFANKQGLNESFVRERLSQGATFESLEKARPAPRQFKISGATMINESKDDDDQPYVARLFG